MKTKTDNAMLLALLAIALLLVGMSVAGRFAQEEESTKLDPPRSSLKAASRDEAEQILAATRARIDQVTREMNREMEARAKK